MEEKSLDEEFREFDREVLVEEIRVRRTLSVEEQFTHYLAFCEEASQWRGPPARVVQMLEDRERDAMLERLLHAVNGP